MKCNHQGRCEKCNAEIPAPGIVEQAVELLTAALAEVAIMRDDPDHSSYTPSEFEDDVTDVVLILLGETTLEERDHQTPRGLQNDIRAIGFAAAGGDKPADHFCVTCPYCMRLVSIEYDDEGSPVDQFARCLCCGRTVGVTEWGETAYDVEVLDVEIVTST